MGSGTCKVVGLDTPKGGAALKDIHRVALLYDFYGPLLTARQQGLVRDYYLNDLSLGEIAAEFGVTRQAVHDLLRRAEAALERYEEKLGLVQEYMGQHARLRALHDLLVEVGTQLPAVGPAGSLVQEARRLAERLLEPK